MEVKHVILGALMEQPDYGYRLKTGYSSRVMGEFGINEGQLYPALKKLESQGSVTKEIVIQESAPNRHRYSITEKGRQEFMQWLADSSGEDRAFRYELLRRDEFFSRAMYLKYLGRQCAEDKVTSQIRIVEKIIEDFTRAIEDMRARDIDPLRIKILEYGMVNQKARLKWLWEFLDTIQQYNWRENDGT